MSNRTYICAECRTSTRAEAAGGLETPFRCPSCGGELCELSPQFRIPKKTDNKAWRDLKTMVQESQPARQHHIQKRLQEKGATLLREIDWQTGVIERQEPSESRANALERLHQERADVLARSLPGRSASPGSPV